MGDDALQKCVVGSFRAAKDVIAAVLDAIDAFRGSREAADDLTLVAVQLAPKSAETSATQPQKEPAVA